MDMRKIASSLQLVNGKPNMQVAAVKKMLTLAAVC
jgi:hypothetical protein